MRFSEEGILDSSVHHFAHPSAFAREHLFYVQSLGRFDVDASYRVNRFNFSSYLLIAPVAGEISCTLDGQSATAMPGSVLLLDCHRPHAYRAVTPGTFYFLHFGGAASEALYRLIGGPCGLKVSAEVIGDVKALLHMREEDRWDEYAVSGAVYGLLMALLREAGKGDQRGDDQQVITPIIEYIAGHMQDKLTVDTLADRFGYSAGYLTRLFRRYTDCSPYQFILRTRLDHGKHLLATSDLPVQEIADQTGFSSLANFCSAFRKYAGQTPGEFRKRPL